MSRNISEERKALYMVGTIMTGIGGLMFAAPFVVIALSLLGAGGGGMHPGLPGQGAMKSIPASFGVAIVGFFILAIGGFLRIFAAKGAAGSGLVLDPPKAREDLEPHARMAGGLLKDALDEAGVLPAAGSAVPAPQKVVMIKCRACGKLNEEDSKFCQECAAPM
jgi:hypothetical protein